MRTTIRKILHPMHGLLPLAFVLLHLTVPVQAQSFQKGRVFLYDSGRTPIEGVQILALGATPTDSDMNGCFLLQFPHFEQGQLVLFQEISKKGYELVNENLIEEWILSEKRAIDLVMAPSGTVDKVRQKLYGICETRYTRSAAEKRQELQELMDRGLIDRNQMTDSIRLLNTQLQEQRLRMERYADRVARINPDDVNGFEKEILEVIENGDFDKAIAMYEESRILERAMDEHLVFDKVQEEIIRNAEMLHRYADICLIRGTRKDLGTALSINRKICQALPEDYSCHYEMYTCCLLSDQKDTESWFRKTLDLATDMNQILSLYLHKISFERINWYGSLQHRLSLTKEMSGFIEELNREGIDVLPHLKYELSYEEARIMVEKGEMEKGLSIMEETVPLMQALFNEYSLPGMKEKLLEMYDFLLDIYHRRNMSDRWGEAVILKYKARMILADDENERTRALFETYTSLGEYFRNQIPEISRSYYEKADSIALQQIHAGSADAEWYRNNISLNSLGLEETDIDIETKIDRISGELDDLALQFSSRVYHRALCNLLESLILINYKPETADSVATRLESVLQKNNTYIDMTDYEDAMWSHAALSLYHIKNRNDMDASDRHFKRFLEIYRSFPSSHSLSIDEELSVINKMATRGGFLMSKDRLKEAQESLDEALKLLSGIREKFGGQTFLAQEANICNNMGGVLEKRKDLSGALKYYSRAYQIDMAYSEVSPLYTMEAAWVLANISNISYRLGDQKKAWESLKEAKMLSESLREAYPSATELQMAVLDLMEAELTYRTGNRKEGRKLRESAMARAMVYSEDLIVKDFIRLGRKWKIYSPL